MRDLVIRAGGDADIDAIAQVWVASWTSTGLLGPDDTDVSERRARMAEILTDGLKVFVAEREEEIAGYLVVDLSDNFLAQLFVAPRHQGSGVGKALMNLARDQMPREIWLRTPTANKRAVAWYEREGFRLEREEPHPIKPHRLTRYYRWRAGDGA